jgi:competence protein ComEC
MATFLRYGAAAFLIGVGVRSFFVIHNIFASSLLLAAAIVLAFFATKIFTDRKVIIVAAILLGTALGIFRYDAATRLSSSPLSVSVGRMISMSGMIVTEPEQKGRYQQVMLEINGSERLLIYAPRYPELKYGDVVEARGKLTEPENFSDFDWRAYLAKDGVHYEIKNAAVRVTGEGGSAVKRALFVLARDFKTRLGRLLSEPEGAFMNGILLGDKSGLPQSLNDDFRQAGVMHLVALSGYNISVVAKNVARGMSLLPVGMFAGQAVGLIAVIMFVIMTGASTTAIRAGVMAAILVLAKFSGRVYLANNALYAAAFFMVLWNPLILKDDISFQLSFLATWGIINIAPYFAGRFNFLPDVFSEALATTIAAQIMVTPLLIYFMGTFSLVSVPANLAILPFIPMTMSLGFLLYPISFLGAIATPFAWVTSFMLWYEIAAAHFFAQLPFAQIIF